MSILSKYSKNSYVSKWGFSDDILPNAAVYEMAVKMDGSVVSTPVEEGSFTSYNKTLEPVEIAATLAFSGSDTYLQSIIDDLKKLQQGVTVFSIKTPTYEYQKMTLQGFNYSLRREDGIGALYVDADFVEIREVQLAYTNTSEITQEKSKDASGVSTVDNGISNTVELSADAKYTTGTVYSALKEFTVASKYAGTVDIKIS